MKEPVLFLVIGGRVAREVPYSAAPLFILQRIAAGERLRPMPGHKSPDAGPWSSYAVRQMIAAAFVRART